jgi:hypothetical protein
MLMEKFAFTFGQKYRYYQHPTFSLAHPDGYVVVEAENKQDAIDFIFNKIGERWAFCYDMLNPLWWEISLFFPQGELVSWIVHYED